jgi:hypothetical protein
MFASASEWFSILFTRMLTACPAEILGEQSVGFPRTSLLFEVTGDSHNVLVGTKVTLLGDLSPGSGGVATTLLPTLDDLVFVRCQGVDISS